MASTFSPNKLYELMATGDKSGTWGNVANTNVFSVIDTNLGGRLSKDCSGSSNVTLSATDAQNLYHTLTGTLTGSIQYIVPSRGSFYFTVYYHRYSIVWFGRNNPARLGGFGVCKSRHASGYYPSELFIVADFGYVPWLCIGWHQRHDRSGSDG